MQRMQLSVFCVVFVLSFAAFSVLAQEQPAGEKIELTWKFQKGQKLEYVQKNTSATSRNIPGKGEMKQSGMQETGMVQEVTEIDEKGVATVQLKYSYVKVKPEGPQGDRNFDSTDKESLEKAKKEEMWKRYVGMLEKPFSFKIDRNGTVLEVKGFTEMIKEMSKDNPRAQEIGKVMFGDEAVKKMLQTYYLLPKEKVGKGDSWTTTSEIPLGPMGTMKIESKFTFEGMEKLGERQCAKMKSEVTKLSLEGGMGGMFTISKPEGSGTYYFDTANGILVKMESKMTYTMVMEMPASKEQLAPSVKITSEVTNSMILKEPAKEEPKKEEEKK
jgi:hypothetical protein